MEKRYGFIRSSNPFEGLDDYAKSRSLSVSTRKIYYHSQSEFEGMGTGGPGPGLRVRLGYFYELMTRAIYGGVAHDSTDLGRRAGNHVRSEPDVVHHKSTHLIESKAVSPGESLKIKKIQTAKYAHLQLGNYFENAPTITFQIYRHGVRRLMDRFSGKSVDSLVEELSATTKFGIRLPFSAITHILETKCEYTSNYEGDAWEHITRLLSSGLNDLIAYPRRTLQRLGLNTRLYSIELSRFPEGVKVNSFPIAPFPILIVNDRSHNSWLKRFRTLGLDKYNEMLLSEGQDVEKLTAPLFDNLPLGNDLDLEFDPEKLEKLPPSISTSQEGDDEVPF